MLAPLPAPLFAFPDAFSDGPRPLSATVLSFPIAVEVFFPETNLTDGSRSAYLRARSSALVSQFSS